MELKSGMSIMVAACLTLFPCADSQACSLRTSEIFQTGSKTKAPSGNELKDGETGRIQEPVPAPVVVLADIIRGTAPPGHTCNDAGRIYIEVSMPDGSSNALNDFGIQFRPLDSTNPYAPIFPDVPLVPRKATDGRYYIFLAWLDGTPRTQETINMMVDAFFVSADRKIGPSTPLRVYSEPGH